MSCLSRMIAEIFHLRRWLFMNNVKFVVKFKALKSCIKAFGKL